jgi:hypothetical protein
MLTPGGKPIRVNVISLKHKVKQGRKPHTIPLIDKSGIRFLAECAKERVDNGRDCMILWTGDRGAGKSTGILETALEIDPGFDIDSITFWLEDFGAKFASNPQGGVQPDGSTIYPQNDLDEAGHALYGPQWLAREQLEISKNMIINRIMRQIVHIAVPKRKQFNNQIRDMAFLWAHVSEPKEYKQGYAVVRMAPVEKQSEFHTEKYWEPKFAFIFPEMTGDLWDRYEAKKIAFVREASKDMGKATGSKAAKFSAARDVLLKEYYGYRKQAGDPISCEALGEIVGLRTTQVWNILHDK